MSWHGEVVWVTDGMLPLVYHLIPHRQFRIGAIHEALCGRSQYMMSARFVTTSEKLLVEGRTLCELCIMSANRRSWP